MFKVNSKNTRTNISIVDFEQINLAGLFFGIALVFVSFFLEVLHFFAHCAWWHFLYWLYVACFCLRRLFSRALMDVIFLLLPGVVMLFTISLFYFKLFSVVSFVFSFLGKHLHPNSSCFSVYGWLFVFQSADLAELHCFYLGKLKTFLLSLFCLNLFLFSKSSFH